MVDRSHGLTLHCMKDLFDTAVLEYHGKAKKSRPLPSRPVNSPQCMMYLNKSDKRFPFILDSRLMAADPTNRLVADLHTHAESVREPHRPPVGVGGSDSVGEALYRAVDELVPLLDELLVMVPRTTTLSRVGGRGGGSSRGRRRNTSAGESSGVARGTRSRVGDSSGGSSESRGVVVGADATRDHVDGHEALVAIEAETGDRSLDALEETAAILDLLLVVRQEVELVAADMVVPHEGASGSDAAGSVAHAVLVAAVLVADLGVGEVHTEDIVEDGAAVGPGGVVVVGRQDVEGVALVKSSLVGHDGCCNVVLAIELFFVED